MAVALSLANGLSTALQRAGSASRDHVTDCHTTYAPAPDARLTLGLQRRSCVLERFVRPARIHARLSRQRQPHHYVPSALTAKLDGGRVPGTVHQCLLVNHMQSFPFLRPEVTAVPTCITRRGPSHRLRLHIRRTIFERLLNRHATSWSQWPTIV